MIKKSLRAYITRGEIALALSAMTAHRTLACRQTVFMGMMAALPGLSLFVGIVMTALSV